jgi:hypothetical protein
MGTSYARLFIFGILNHCDRAECSAKSRRTLTFDLGTVTLTLKILSVRFLNNGLNYEFHIWYKDSL